MSESYGCLPGRQGPRSSRSVTPKPAVVKDARRAPAVARQAMPERQEAAATVRSRANPTAIQAVLQARVPNAAKAVVLARDANVVRDANVARALMVAKVASVAPVASVATAATQASAATEEVATRRRTVTRSFRPEIRRECPPAGAGTAIVCHVSAKAILVAGIAMA